ncbi:MAG: hypothetical protein DMG14_18500 [Acidobacteria bacterium]|nr:MAG: hypothetical protein DMG14_18500 [Acidobacteriota bacterium]
MAKTVHVFELSVEVEPFRPRVERRASFMSHIVVSAAAVAFRPMIAAAIAQLLQDLSRPPVEMGVDDPHGVYLGFGSDFASALDCYAERCVIRLQSIAHRSEATGSTPPLPQGQIDQIL